MNDNEVYRLSDGWSRQDVLTSLRDLAWCAFCRDFEELLRSHRGRWVAYRGDARICIGDSKPAVYDECLLSGHDPEELFVEMIYPGATDVPTVILPPIFDTTENES